MLQDEDEVTCTSTREKNDVAPPGTEHYTYMDLLDMQDIRLSLLLICSFRCLSKMGEN